MKRVILLVTTVAFLTGLSSCGRECVCTEKEDGEVTGKIIVKKDNGGGWCESDHDDDYEYICK